MCCAAVSLALGACAPEIGDECKTALDCSAQGSRLCDRTQPHGYCTLRGCEPGTCPEEAVCVKFRPQEERLAITYCMAKCDDDGDCRSDEDYRCTSVEEFGERGGGDAEILGRREQQFCSAPAAPAPSVAPDERTPDERTPDASATADGGDAAASSTP